MKSKRKVSFYKLAQEKHILIQEQNTTQVRELSSNSIRENFETIYNNRATDLTSGSKAISIVEAQNKYVVEIISYADHKAFLKIGQQNPTNTVALRDENTLETADVPMSETQLLELFTYCLIDFDTLIVSYIGINGAPKISAIKAMFNEYFSSGSTYTKLAAIMTNDILQTLINKNIISKLSITVAVPSDDILSEVIGLNENDFDSLRNVKTRTATYKLVATRNKNIFESSGRLAEMIASIKTKFGDNLKGLSANAKDFSENSQTYNLLQYSFTKTVVLGDQDADAFVENDFKYALEETYRINQEELLRYC